MIMLLPMYFVAVSFTWYAPCKASHSQYMGDDGMSTTMPASDDGDVNRFKRCLGIVWLNSGDLEPTSGEARRSHTLRVGRYAQHFVDALKFDTNPVEYLLAKYPKVQL